MFILGIILTLVMLRRNTWFRDQYQHPFEKGYSHKTLRSWFEDEGISYFDLIPKFGKNDFGYNFYCLLILVPKGALHFCWQKTTVNHYELKKFF